MSSVRFYVAITCVCLIGVCSNSSHASVLTSRLTFDGPVHHTLLAGAPFQGGGEDKLQDDSVSALVEAANGAPGLSVGDIIYGVVNMTNTQASTQTNQGISQTEQITLVFSAQITGGGGAGVPFTLGAIGDIGSAYDLRNLMSASILDDFTSGPDDDSIFVIMSNPTGTAEVGGINPLNISSTSIGSTLTNANGWTGDAIGGLLDGDFFEFLATGGLSGIERGGFSIQTHNMGSVAFLPVDTVNSAGTISFHDVTLDIGSVNAASAEEQNNGWLFADQSSFYVNAVATVPEPAAVLVWSTISVAAACWAAFKKRA